MTPRLGTSPATYIDPSVVVGRLMWRYGDSWSIEWTGYPTYIHARATINHRTGHDIIWRDSAPTPEDLREVLIAHLLTWGDVVPASMLDELRRPNTAPYSTAEVRTIQQRRAEREAAQQAAYGRRLEAERLERSKRPRYTKILGW